MMSLKAAGLVGELLCDSSEGISQSILSFPSGTPHLPTLLPDTGILQGLPCLWLLSLPGSRAC